VLAIDLNPNYIGVAVCDEGRKRPVHTEVISLVALNKNSTTSQKKHWMLEVSKHIGELAHHYRAHIAVEALGLAPKDH